MRGVHTAAAPCLEKKTGIALFAYSGAYQPSAGRIQIRRSYGLGD